MEKNDQQWENIKAWLVKNGLLIGLVVVLGGGGAFGWGAWQSSQEEHKRAASTLYDQVLEQANADNVTEAEQILSELRLEYADTAYPVLASLSLAKSVYEKGNMASAEKALIWVTENTTDELFLQVSGDRLGRLLLDLKRPDEAIERLQKLVVNVSTANGIGILQMTIADGYVMKQQYALARDMYDSAVQNLPENSPLKKLIEIKVEGIQSL